LSRIARMNRMNRTLLLVAAGVLLSAPVQA
jgi:hypothetical protein